MRLKVVYIAGYGRSGSTLLERVLSLHSDVVGCGEVYNLYRPCYRGVCSCEEKLESCDFWGDVIEEMGHVMGFSQNMRRVEDIVHGLYLRGLPNVMKNYNKFWSSFFLKVREKSGCTYIVDSSKTDRLAFWRPHLLRACDGFDLKVIHLVRHPEKCVASYRKVDNWRVEQEGRSESISFPSIRVYSHWPIANLSAHLFQRTDPKNYFLLRWEDFLSDPVQTTQRVYSFLGLQVDDVLETVKNMAVGGVELPITHQLAGNRVRKERMIKLRPDRDQANLSPLARVLCGRMARSCGYEI